MEQNISSFQEFSKQLRLIEKGAGLTSQELSKLESNLQPLILKDDSITPVPYEVIRTSQDADRSTLGKTTCVSNQLQPANILCIREQETDALSLLEKSCEGESRILTSSLERFAVKLLEVDLSLNRGILQQYTNEPSLYGFLARKGAGKIQSPPVAQHNVALPPISNNIEEKANSISSQAAESKGNQIECREDITEEVELPHLPNKMKLMLSNRSSTIQRPILEKNRQCKHKIFTQAESNNRSICPSDAEVFCAKTELKRALESFRDSEKVVEKNIQEGMTSLPLEYLMKHNMQTYCQRKGGEIVLKYMRHFLGAFKTTAFHQWIEYAKRHREIERWNNALIIERFYRGWKGRKNSISLNNRALEEVMRIRSELANFLKTREDAALNIQRSLRGHKGRLLAFEKRRVLAAIIRVQNHWRIRKSRFILLVLKSLKHKKTVSAILIQSAYRGMIGRRMACTLRRDTELEQREALLADEGYLRRRRFAETGAASVIQRARRCYVMRGTIRFVGHEISTIIQTTWRAYFERQRFKIKTKLRSYAHWIENNSIVFQEYAIKLQRILRSRISLSRIKALKSKIEQERTERINRKKEIMKKRKKKNTNRKLIEGLYNFTVGRKQRVQSSITIQKIWRGKVARRQFKSIKRKHDKELRQRATIRLQSHWRVKIARMKTINLVNTRAAICLQACWKGYTVRVLLKRKKQHNSAATIIQKFWRTVKAKVIFELHRTNHIERCQQQIVIAKYLRRMLVLKNQPVQLELRRREAEIQELGMRETHIARLNERDRILISTAYRGFDEEPQLETQLLFRKICEQANKATNNDKNKVDIKRREITMGNASFLRFCRASQLALETGDKKKPGNISRLGQNEVDLVFVKCCKGNKMKYDTFIDAIELIADALFPDITKIRKKTDAEAKLIHIMEQHILKDKYYQNGMSSIVSRTEQRLNTLATRIQSAYRRYQSKTVVYTTQLAIQQQKRFILEKTSAEIIQRAWRCFSAKHLLVNAMKSAVICFVDTETQMPYWLNPKTGRTTWEKPRILEGHNEEVDTIIYIPPERHQLVTYCSRCTEKLIKVFCDDCEEYTCKECFDLFHAKGKRANHTSLNIKTCIQCQFQLATRICNDCKSDCFCDSCFMKTHESGTWVNHSYESMVKSTCQICESRTGRYSLFETISCSFCVEDYFRMDLASLHTIPFETNEIMELRKTRERKEMLDEQEAYAMQREEYRQFQERNKAAIVIQTCFRGIKFRRSEIGKEVKKRINEAKRKREMIKQDQKISKVVKNRSKLIGKTAMVLSNSIKAQFSKKITKDTKENIGEDTRIDNVQNVKSETSEKTQQVQKDTIHENKREDSYEGTYTHDAYVSYENGEGVVVYENDGSTNAQQQEYYEVWGDEGNNADASSWVRSYDETSQNEYWYNTITGESSWENPYHSQELATNYAYEATDPTPAPAPVSEQTGWDLHWEECFDEDSGFRYWYNATTGESTWEKPY